MPPVYGQIYRHYKSTGGSNHTYVIIGLAKHSETKEILVIYKPLCNNTRLSEVEFLVRLIGMRNKTMDYKGRKMIRFKLINDLDCKQN